jgi:hypothetical protein
VVTYNGNTGGLEKDGHAFSGWSRTQDGSGTLNENNEFDITANTTLYGLSVTSPYLPA